jgi:hypothetical protein
VINDGRRIAKELKVSEATITMDMKYLRSQAKQQISKHIEEQMPLEYQKCLVGLDDTTGPMSDIMEEKEQTRRMSYRLQLFECRQSGSKQKG